MHQVWLQAQLMGLRLRLLAMSLNRGCSRLCCTGAALALLLLLGIKPGEGAKTGHAPRQQHICNHAPDLIMILPWPVRYSCSIMHCAFNYETEQCTYMHQQYL
jgi:hypothetical protein